MPITSISNFPSTRPTLSLDFGNSQLVDSRITYNRADTAINQASYYDKHGVLRFAELGAPRITHDPITKQCLGLLIEQSRTNLLLNSENYQTTWAVSNTSNASITNVNASNPSDTNNVGLFVCTTVASVNRRLFCSGDLTASASTAYTFSIYVKSVNWQYIHIRLSPVAVTTEAIADANYNLVDATVVQQNIGTATINQVGNGWYRLTLTGTTPAGTTLIRPSIVLVDGPTKIAATAAVGVVNAGIQVFGGQLEAGAEASSYIRTSSTSSVTRALDYAYIDQSNFKSFYGDSKQGSLVIEYTLLYKDSALSVISLEYSANAGGNHIRIRHNATKQAHYVVTDGGTGQVNMLPTGYATTNTLYKRAVAFANNSFQQAVNGVLSPAEDTAGTVPTTINRMRIGSETSDGGLPINGCIRKIAFYPTRLSNEQLQLLTQV